MLTCDLLAEFSTHCILVYSYLYLLVELYFPENCAH